MSDYKQFKPKIKTADNSKNHSVVIKTCPLYWETFKKYKNIPGLVDVLRQFRIFKTTNPNEKFGSKDYLMAHKGPLGANVPGLLHAGLTDNISIYYTIDSKNPTVLKLYGIFSHDETGTGQPANVNRQRSMGQQFGNQRFSE